MNFNDIEDEAMEHLENDDDGLINMLDENKKGHQIAISLLGKTGMNGYTRIKNMLILQWSYPLTTWSQKEGQH